MAGADHVSINSKVTMNKLQKINYKGESRYEYLRKVLFTRQNKFSSPPESALKTRRLTKHIVFYNLCPSIPNIPLFASGVLLTK